MHTIVRNWWEADLTPTDRALCEYASRLTHNQSSSSAEHLETLRAHGLTDRAIHDATQVIAYFNYISRIADALGVEPETFIAPWGDPNHL